MAKQMTITEKRKRYLDVASSAVKHSAMTLAQHGLDPEKFGLIIREAVLANPDVLKSDEQSFARAIRKCCINNIIPDGDQGAIVVFGGEAVAMPMVMGIKRMAYEALGADIREGVVYEGDDMTITEEIGPEGVETTISLKTTTDSLKNRKGSQVIGAWCWLKLPDEKHARVTTFSQDDIDRTKKVSRAKSGPWQTWPDRMAAKSCVKSAIWRLRYMANVERRGAKLLNIIEEDTVAEFGPVTIEAEAEPVAEEVRVETTTAPPAPETLQTRQAPAPQTQQAPAKAAATGKKPGRPKMTEEERMAAALKRQREREAGEREAAEKQAQAAAQETHDPDFGEPAQEGDYFEAGEGEEEPFLPNDNDDPTSL